MSSSPGAGGSNPRKFSEKIALHTQRQAEETRAFEQLMTDLTVSRVQFQKVQQLRSSQSRAPYYGGSLPNVNQIASSGADFQGGFPAALDSVRGTRHHGLVERVHRERSRINAPHRRPIDKHGRQMESSPHGAVYLSPPPDNSWRRTNSDSALHTSAMNPQEGFSLNQQLERGATQRNGWRAASVTEVEVDGSGDIFSFPALPGDDRLMGVSKPLPKQLWEAKKVQSLASRPKSCEVPGINIFPSPEQSVGGLSHYQSSLSTGGSLPDLSNLQFPSPLCTPLDPDDNNAYANLSGGSSTGNLPAAMMHLGLGGSQGLSSSLSNPSIQASLTTCQLQSSLSNPSIHSSTNPSIHSSTNPSIHSSTNPSIHSSVRLSSSSPRRRPPPISPLTLSPGGKTQLSPNMSPLGQGVPLDTSSLPREPPPPYPLYQHAAEQSRHRPPAHLQQQQQQQQQQRQHHLQQQQATPPLDYNSQHNNMAALFSESFLEQQFSSRHNKNLPYQLEQFSLLENALGSSAVAPCYASSSSSSSPPPSSSSLYYSPASGAGLQEQLRSSSLYSQCGVAALPNIILTDDSASSLSRDLSGVGGCFGSASFPLEDELHIEPLSLDGLSMLSDPDMVLPDPSVEDSFRSDRL